MLNYFTFRVIILILQNQGYSMSKITAGTEIRYPLTALCDTHFE